MSETPPELPVVSARRSLWERFSIVWLVPLTALLIALGVAWQVYSERGPVILIAFDNASGINKGETELRFRDVAVGVVEELAFTASQDRVVASVRVDKDIAPYIDSEASFWVVQPEVTTRGITGLSTVLSGVFIEGVWDNEPGGFAPIHEGLDTAPLLTAGERGLRIRLNATEGVGLNPASPIIFKGITVGEVGKPELASDGSAAGADAVIFEPYDRLITTATRFWDISGFTFSFGASGAVLDVTSLATLISGGVTFETVVSGGQPVRDGAAFDLYPDEGAARSSIFVQGQGPALNLTVIFRENVSGLVVGAPVELRGVRIGEVANLTGIVDPERFGDEVVRLLTTLKISPSRLGFTGPDAAGAALDFFEERVEGGLRARLANASLLTGGLKVELAEVPDAPPEALDRTGEPFPLLPSVESDVADVAVSAEGLFERVAALPVEELMQSAIDFLDGATAFATGDDLNRVPREVNDLMAEIRGVVGSDEVQALPGQISALVGDLQATAADLQAVVASIEDAETVDRLTSAIEATSDAATLIGDRTEGVPELIERLTAVAEKAEALPAEELIEELTAAVDAAEAFIASEGVQTLPATVNEAVAEVQAIVAELRDTGTVTGLNEALASAGSAAAALEEAAASLPETATLIGERTEGVPELIERLTAVAEKAEALAAEELIAELTETVDAAGAFIASENVQALPATVNEAVAEVRGAIAELREAGTVENLNRTFVSAEEAASAVESAVAGLPDTVEQITALAARADEALATVEGLLASEGMQSLPQTVRDAVAEIQAVLTEVREAGTVASLNEALGSAGDAAAAVEEATQRLPEIAEQIESLVTRANQTLATADTFIASEGVQALPDAVNAALADIDAILTELQEAGTVEALNRALGSAGDAAAAVEDVTARVPEIAERIETLVARAGEALATAEAFIASEGVQTLPASVNEALAEVEAVLSELREGGTVENLNRTLASAGDAADAVEEATGRLPEIAEQLEALVARANETLASADTLLASEGMQSLPDALNDAFGEVDAILTELRETGTVTSLNRTLDSAGDAAAAVAEASARLPEISARIERLVASATDTLDGYAGNSEFNRQARAALRDIQSAAKAVASLSRALERRPNSIILGR